MLHYFLVSNKDIANYYEETISHCNEPILVANWIRIHVMQILNRDKIDITDFNINPKRLAEIIDLLILSACRPVADPTSITNPFLGRLLSTSCHLRAWVYVSPILIG